MQPDVEGPIDDFRDETDTARSGSIRGRSQRRRTAGTRALLGLQERQGCIEAPSSSQTNRAGPESRFSADLQPDRSAQLVEQMFTEWTLVPSRKLEHAVQLPLLHVKTAPHSLLWLAVRALAYAHCSEDITAAISHGETALDVYGRALSILRNAAGDPQNLQDNEVLGAILLLDNFEVGRVDLGAPSRHALLTSL